MKRVKLGVKHFDFSPNDLKIVPTHEQKGVQKEVREMLYFLSPTLENF